jgi:hypothetical protein
MKREMYGSPEKRARVVGVMSSSHMQKTLCYEDNDPSHGMISPKAQPIYTSAHLKKESWKPKTSLKWDEPYRTPLTLQ